MILLIAIFFAGVIGLIYIYIDSLINNKVEDKKMLRSLTKVPLSGTIPLMQNSTSNVVMRTGDITPESEAFRALRTNLKFTFKQPTDKTERSVPTALFYVLREPRVSPPFMRSRKPLRCKGFR